MGTSATFTNQRQSLPALALMFNGLCPLALQIGIRTKRCSLGTVSLPPWGVQVYRLVTQQ